jgi:hypothetical protein
MLAIYQAAVDEMKVTSVREKENLNVCNAKKRGPHSPTQTRRHQSRGSLHLTFPYVLR